MDQKTNLTVIEALELLQAYSCIQPKKADTPVAQEQLRQALHLITSLSDYQNFGICADNLPEGLAALSAYLKALGYNFNLDSISQTDGDQPIYIKYNTQKQTCYLDSYNGSYRGVLISCQSDNDQIAGTYGHFPLNLFI